MTTATQVGAFFDLDGTLLSGPSLELRFLRWLVNRKQITTSSAIRWLAHFSKAICPCRVVATRANKHYLAGLPVSLVSDWAVSLKPASLVYPQALARISWHQAQRHRVFIVSGTLAPLARLVARHISPDVEVAATELEITDGRWTGSLMGEHLSRAAKRHAIGALVAKYDLRLDLSYAYGNAMADFAMLDSVAHPLAVNPTFWLRRNALKRKWQISHWESVPPTLEQTVFAVAKEPS